MESDGPTIAFSNLSSYELSELAASADVSKHGLALLEELAVRDLRESAVVLLSRLEGGLFVASNFEKLIAIAASHASNDALATLVQAFLQMGGDPKAGSTYVPIIYAASNDNVEGVQVLLDHGFDLQASDEDGWTSLHWAAHNGNVELAHVLLERGAGVDAFSADGTTPVWIAAGEDEAAVVQLLLASGADPNQVYSSDYGSSSLLMHAVQYKATEVVRVLLENGASPTLEVGGETPLHVSAEYGTAEIDELLKRAAEAS